MSRFRLAGRAYDFTGKHCNCLECIFPRVLALITKVKMLQWNVMLTVKRWLRTFYEVGWRTNPHLLAWDCFDIYVRELRRFRDANG